MTINAFFPKAPKYQELPTAKLRATRGGPEVVELRVRLEVVTPILGGSHQPRDIDAVDVIRVPSIRGHLRFWWRALYAAQYANADELYQHESALWGCAATDDGGRSAAEVHVNVEHTGGTDNTEIRLYPGQGQQATPGAYALWPARAETMTNTPTAPRRQPGTQFQLTLKVAGSDTNVAEVRNALRAWILFGGYGGRTRRGLGSLKVIQSPHEWLPAEPTRDALKDFFGFDIFDSPTHAPGDSPWLRGAALQVGKAERDAIKAWTTALDWLKEFRQGTSGQQGARAREPGTGKQQPHRPSISNWPEGDKIRRLATPQRGLHWAHTPKHNQTPAWPRAGFGLPIIGQFQSRSREEHPTRKKRNGKPDEMYWNELPQNHPNYGTEPESFELRWRAGTVEHDRLASPLIVKALPLADGTFAPCALWLNRAHPANGQVILRNVNNSQAPFDRLVAAGDNAQFSALAGKSSLRAAFLDWLHATYHTTVVAL